MGICTIKKIGWLVFTIIPMLVACGKVPLETKIVKIKDLQKEYFLQGNWFEGEKTLYLFWHFTKGQSFNTDNWTYHITSNSGLTVGNVDLSKAVHLHQPTTCDDQRCFGSYSLHLEDEPASLLFVVDLPTKENWQGLTRIDRGTDVLSSQLSVNYENSPSAHLIAQYKDSFLSLPYSPAKYGLSRHWQVDSLVKNADITPPLVSNYVDASKTPHFACDGNGLVDDSLDIEREGEFEFTRPLLEDEGGNGRCVRFTLLSKEGNPLIQKTDFAFKSPVIEAFEKELTLSTSAEKVYLTIRHCQSDKHNNPEYEDYQRRFFPNSEEIPVCYQLKDHEKFITDLSEYFAKRFELRSSEPTGQYVIMLTLHHSIPQSQHTNFQQAVDDVVELIRKYIYEYQEVSHKIRSQLSQEEQQAYNKYGNIALFVIYDSQGFLRESSFNKLYLANLTEHPEKDNPINPFISMKQFADPATRKYFTERYNAAYSWKVMINNEIESRHFIDYDIDTSSLFTAGEDLFETTQGYNYRLCGLESLKHYLYVNHKNANHSLNFSAISLATFSPLVHHNHYSWNRPGSYALFVKASLPWNVRFGTESIDETGGLEQYETLLNWGENFWFDHQQVKYYLEVCKENCFNPYKGYPSWLNAASEYYKKLFETSNPQGISNCSIPQRVL